MHGYHSGMKRRARETRLSAAAVAHLQICDGRNAAQMCKPAGYFVVVDFDNFTDIWAFCALRLVIRNDNTGAPDNILYDQPLGWWDAHWPGSHHTEGCYTNDDAVFDNHFEVRP